MTCHALREELPGLLRERLDGPERAAAEEHLLGCEACRRALEEERLLDELLARRPLPPAPPALRARLEALARPPRPSARRALLRPLPRLLWPVLAACLAVALAAVVARSGRITRERLVAEAVDDHLRVMAAAHPLEIEDGGPHQVKPWFEGRLDFGPEVPTAEGTELRLRGGAIGYLFDRRAAVVVYALRRHAVTLLAFPAVDLPLPADGAAPRAAGERGFHAFLWRRGDVGYALVSDANAAELGELAARLAGK